MDSERRREAREGAVELRASSGHGSLPELREASSMDEFEGLLRLLLGLGIDSKEINALQMGLRAVLVYVVTVLMVRLAKKRFMGWATAFDVILGIMLGSIVSRAVTGNAPLLPALVAAAALLMMHAMFS